MFQDMKLPSSNIKKFLIFRIWNFLGSYFSHIPREKFLSPKNKKKTTLRTFLIFQEMELSSPKLKKFLIFSGGNFQSLKISYIFFHIFCFLERTFQTLAQKRKIPNTFRYKEPKGSKLR